MASKDVLELLSQSVYDKSKDPIPEGWEELSDGYYEDKEENTGFYGQAYINRDTNEIVLAIRGTDDWFGTDIKSDYAIFNGEKVPQFQKALEFYDQVISAIHGTPFIDSEIYITGHSLGGACAQYLAAKHLPRIMRAETFNAPGIWQCTKDEFQNYLAEYDDKIFNHITIPDGIANFGQHLGQRSYYVSKDAVRQLVTGAGGLVMRKPEFSIEVIKGLATAHKSSNIRGADPVAIISGEQSEELNGYGESLNVVKNMGEQYIYDLADIDINSKDDLLNLMNEYYNKILRKFSFSGGGYVTGSGTSTSDSIPAWLSNGEYVIRADAVSKWGVNFLNAINSGRLPSGTLNGVNNAAASDPSQAVNRVGQSVDSLTRQLNTSASQALDSFFNTGILKCNSLGDAFRQLALTVLQSIQRVYAQAMTERIKSMLGLGTTPNARPAISGVTVQGPLKPDGTFANGGKIESGKVTGPGTGTSDSILAWVGNQGKFIRISNGEYVIRADAVAKWGTNFLDSINSGRVPGGFYKVRARYATGGSVSDRTIPGPQELTSSLVNNNSVGLKIINVTDPNEVGRYLQTRAGGKVMINFIKNNSTVVKHLLK